MKVYNEKHSDLTLNLQKTLNSVRQIRYFNVQQYIKAKAITLNAYMKNTGLNACVVAVSGGIDSAAVLSLAFHAQSQPDSPIKKIIPVTLPVKDTHSATNQNESIEKAQELVNALGLELATIDVTKSYEQIYPQVEKNLHQQEGDNWGRGQLCAYARTPIIYYCTSVLNSQGFRPIVVGTTNRDEGAYLGYVGKASDGMVDIQLISDLHKSEVYKVAQFLNVPSSILKAIPSGDMYDGRNDEEVFGAPYDFVELFLNYKNMSNSTWTNISSHWDDDDWQQFSQYSQALEQLHQYNQHKYWIGSPAIHLDILPSAVEGGWIEGIHCGIFKNKITKIVPTHRFVGFVDSSPQLKSISLNKIQYSERNKVMEVNQLLSSEEIKNFLVWFDNNKEMLSTTDEFGKKTSQAYQGAQRLSFYDEDFAQTLSERLLASGVVKPFTIFNDEDKTNWRPDHLWKFIGLNPMVRVIKYNEGGFLVPHYDDSFVSNQHQKSLVTLIISITNHTEGGATRFLVDPQDNQPFENRDFADWNRQPQTEEISDEFKLLSGNALLFNHRTLHDGQRIEKGEKIILRTELMFETCIFNK